MSLRLCVYVCVCVCLHPLRSPVAVGNPTSPPCSFMNVGNTHYLCAGAHRLGVRGGARGRTRWPHRQVQTSDPPNQGVSGLGMSIFASHCTAVCRMCSRDAAGYCLDILFGNLFVDSGMALGCAGDSGKVTARLSSWSRALQRGFGFRRCSLSVAVTVLYVGVTRTRVAAGPV